jgi:hypothetical protein
MFSLQYNLRIDNYHADDVIHAKFSTGESHRSFFKGLSKNISQMFRQFPRAPWTRPHRLNTNATPTHPRSRIIATFLKENQEKHRAIIAKGSLLPYYGTNERPKQADQLPRSAFRLWDMDGNEVQFRFETDGIFAQSCTGVVERIFYDEISQITFEALSGHEKCYAQMTFATVHGFRTYFYFPVQYMNIARNVVKSSQ